MLFGHSDGGSIALLAAAWDPADRIRALVLEAPHVICEDVSVRAIDAARTAFHQGDLRARLARYHRDVDGAFLGWNGAWLDPGFRDWDLRPELPGVRAPVLVVQGRDDPYGTLDQVSAIVAGVAGHARAAVLPACGHAPHKDHPDVVLELVRAFLA